MGKPRPPDWIETIAEEGMAQVVSAGKIHLLGLEAIRARLGDKWEKMSGLVHRYFEAAIRREMQPGDTFQHFGELSYLVLFRGASLAEAQLKCHAIAESVTKRLFGEEDQDVSVRNLTAPLDAMTLDQIEDCVRVNDHLEEFGQETLIHSRAGKTEVTSAATIRVRMSHSGVQHQISKVRPAFVYRPLWDTAKGVVLTYICQPLPSGISAHQGLSGVCLATESEDEQAELDALAFQASIRRVHMLRHSGLRVLIAVPIHFVTLARSRLWQRYRVMQDHFPTEYFRDIAFLIHGIESSIPNIRLTQELPKLTTLSRYLFCLTDNPTNMSQQFDNSGAHAVGLSIGSDRSEREWINRMSTLGREAKVSGKEAFVIGAARRSCAVNAIGAGARYIEGASVRSVVADPKHAFVHEIEDLYRDLYSIA